MRKHPSVERIFDTLEYLETGPYLWIGAAVLLLLIYLLLVMRRQPKVIHAFASSTGDVTVSRQAIREVAQRACDAVDGVGRCNTRMTTRGGRLYLKVKIILLSGYRAVEVCPLLGETLKHSLSDDLGIEELGNIDVMLVGYRPSKNRLRTDREAHEPAAEISPEEASA